jgi:hypothetical protein
MGCGCRKRQGGVAPVAAGGESVSAGAVRGIARSKVAFFVTVDEVERRFSTLREARMAAEAAGVAVETRRVAIEQS